MNSTDTIDVPKMKLQQNGVLSIQGARTELKSKAQLEKLRRARKYDRGRPVDTRAIRDPKLRRNLKTLENKYQTATIRASEAEILDENSAGFLEAEGELERTYRVRQDEILQESAIATAQSKFDLKLEPLGPYIFDYTRNGRELLLGGRKGHVATMEWREGKLGCELQLGETVRCARWLHSNQYFAVAQKKYTYIYDHNGVEIHCLRKHLEVTHMEFLPYHFLLATLGMNGMLKYQDTSTGQLVAEIATKQGTPVSLAQNPSNAILHVGHQNGTVTLWSPNSSDPHVKLLAHRGPVRSLACDRTGNYMVSTGQDNKMAVWDIRMFKEVNNYFTRSPATSVTISDTGLTAVGWGTRTTVWKGLFSQEKVQSPYMTWGGEGNSVERVQFCPFEDSLGIGHSKGFSGIIIPGSGEANFDALEVNPYETTKQRQEGEVKALLNKLPPEMIALDPNFIGNLDLRSDKQRQADRDLDAAPATIEEEIRNRARGRKGALKKYLRKQLKKNIHDEKRMKAEEVWKEQEEKNQERHQQKQAELGTALARFARKE